MIRSQLWFHDQTTRADSMEIKLYIDYVTYLWNRLYNIIFKDRQCRPLEERMIGGNPGILSLLEEISVSRKHSRVNIRFLRNDAWTTGSPSFSFSWASTACGYIAEFHLTSFPVLCRIFISWILSGWHHMMVSVWPSFGTDHETHENFISSLK